MSADATTGAVILEIPVPRPTDKLVQAWRFYGDPALYIRIGDMIHILTDKTGRDLLNALGQAFPKKRARKR